MPFAGDNVPFTGYWHSMCNATGPRGINRMYQKSRNVTATETGAGDNVPFTGYWHSMCNTTVIRGISRMYQKSRNVTATETGGVSDGF